MLPSIQTSKRAVRGWPPTAAGVWLGLFLSLTGCTARAPGPEGIFRDGGAPGSSEAGSQIPFDPADGLILHYAFNETAGNVVHDFAGIAGLNDGIIVGTPVDHKQWEATGRVSGALRLAGNAPPDGGVGHHVELPQGLLFGTGECSIAVWINRAGGDMWQRVFDLGAGPPSWLFFTPYGVTSLPIVAGRTPAGVFVDFGPIAEQDAAEPPAGRGELPINQPIPASTWVHLVLTWTPDRIAVYLNGAIVAETIPVGRLTPTDLGRTGQNYLGRSQFPADPYFGGMLDEFRVYDRALTAGEVAQLATLQ